MIYRYDISSANFPAITWKDIPKGAKFLYAGHQSERVGSVSVWFEVNPEEKSMHNHIFTWFKTGETIPADGSWEYLDSLISNGFYVYHVYYKKDFEDR